MKLKNISPLLSKLALRMENHLFLFYSLIGIVIGCVLLSYSLFAYQKSISETIVSELGNIIADDIIHNENFSDVVSMLYLREKNNPQPAPEHVQEFDKEHNIYGINLDENKQNPDFGGTLQSIKPLTQSALLLSRAIDLTLMHERTTPHSKLIVRRYFISRKNDYIYLYGKLPTSQYVFATYGGKGFGDVQRESRRGYVDLKLSNDIDSASGTLSDIYADVLTGKPTLSIVHTVFDQTKTEYDAVLGYTCLDYELDNFLNKISALGYPSGKDYLTITIDDKQENRKITLLDSRGTSNKSSFAINKRFNFVVSINPWKFYLSQDGRRDIYILLMFIIVMIATYILNHYYIGKHRSAAQTDPLTSLHNRKWLLSWDQVSRKKADYVIALIDCNKFKAINDTHGHALGDEALKFIAKCITDNIAAKRDHAVRLGGDEFMILFHGSSLGQAHDKIQRIALALNNFPYAIPLTISYGFALLKHTRPLMAAVARADENMYLFKKEVHQAESASRE